MIQTKLGKIRQNNGSQVLLTYHVSCYIIIHHHYPGILCNSRGGNKAAQEAAAANCNTELQLMILEQTPLAWAEEQCLRSRMKLSASWGQDGKDGDTRTAISGIDEEIKHTVKMINKRPW